MAAFTGDPHNSPTYARQIGTLKADALDIEAEPFDFAPPVYTHAAAQGAGTGLVNLGLLPAGRVRVYPDTSRLVTSQFGASATVSIGWAAYVDSAGVTQSASAAGFHSVGAAGAGALDAALGAPAAGFKEFDSRDGVVITATVASGDIETADTIWIRLDCARLA